MKLNRRQFLQGLAAGMAVATIPAAIPLVERTEAATNILHAPGWRFIMRGGSGGMGDSLICLAPGVSFNPMDDWPGRTFIWPERLPDTAGEMDEINRPITLMPWQKYRPQVEAMIPDDMRGQYEQACRWRR